MQTKRSFAKFILGEVLIFGLIASMPSLHADARIVFESGKGWNLDIYVMDADGGNRQRLTRDGARRPEGIMVS